MAGPSRAGHRGRSAADGRLPLWSPAADRHSGKVPQMAQPVRRPARARGRLGGSRGNLTRSMLAGLAPEKGVRWRGRLLGPVRPSQGSGHPGPVCLRRFLLLSFGLSCPLRPRPAPPSSGPAGRTIGSGAPSSLISCADCTSLALRVDRACVGAQLRKLRQQPKNNGGRRGSWPVTKPLPAHQSSAKDTQP